MRFSAAIVCGRRSDAASGTSRQIIVGILGGFLGGWLAGLMGIAVDGWLMAIVVAFVGAVILLVASALWYTAGLFTPSNSDRKASRNLPSAGSFLAWWWAALGLNQ